MLPLLSKFAEQKKAASSFQKWESHSTLSTNGHERSSVGLLCAYNHAANGYNIITIYGRTAMVWECKVACDQALIKYLVRQNFLGPENKRHQPLEPPLVPTPLLSKRSMLHVNSILIRTVILVSIPDIAE